jgi:hypothetical protein
MTAKRYLRIRGEIAAIQWTGENTNEIRTFTGGDIFVSPYGTLHVYVIREDVFIAVTRGYWLVSRASGEFHPVSPDVFDYTYEELDTHRYG